MSIEEQKRQLIADIERAHLLYIDVSGKHKLVHDSLVCHLYGDGTITYTKGGHIYGQRSVQNIAPSIPDFIPLLLPIIGSAPAYSYAILSDAECFGFRRRMLYLAERMAHVSQQNIHYS